MRLFGKEIEKLPRGGVIEESPSSARKDEAGRPCESAESAGFLFASRYSFAAWACAVVVALGVWLNFVGRANVLSWTFSSSDWALFYAGRLAALLLAVTAPSKFERYWKSAMVAGGCLLLGGTAVCSLSAYFIEAADSLLVHLGLLACGFGRVCTNMTAYIVLARRHSFKTCVWVASAAIVLKWLLSLSANYLSADACRIVSMALPCFVILGSLCLSKCAKHRPQAKRAAISGTALNYIVMLGVMANCTLFVLTTASSISLAGSASMYSMSDGVLISSSLLGVVSIAVFVCAVHFTVVKQTDKPLMARYLWAFVVLAFAMPVIVLLTNVDDPVAMAVLENVLNGVEFFGHLLMWSIVMEVAQKAQGSAFRSAGVICLSYDLLAALFNVFLNNGSHPRTHIALVALVLGYAIIVLVAIVLPAHASRRSMFSIGLDSAGGKRSIVLKGEQDAEDVASCDELGEAFEKRYNYLLRRYAFTPREQEVFRLLCQGRNRVVINETLDISNNTIKSHISHIYQKMEITSHQELLDIFCGGITSAEREETGAER